MAEKETVPPAELPLDKKLEFLFHDFYNTLRTFNSNIERSSVTLARAITARDQVDVLNGQLSREVTVEKERREYAEAELKEYKTQWVSGWSMCSLLIIVGIILFALK